MVGGDSDLETSLREGTGSRSQAPGWVLGSNPVVGVDLGPDVADHAKKLGQDTFTVFLLGALHALHLAPCSLLHFGGQVPLGAHGLGWGWGEGGERKKQKQRKDPGVWRERSWSKATPIPQKYPDTKEGNTIPSHLRPDVQFHPKTDCTIPTISPPMTVELCAPP